MEPKSVENGTCPLVETYKKGEGLELCCFDNGNRNKKNRNT